MQHKGRGEETEVNEKQRSAEGMNVERWEGEGIITDKHTRKWKAKVCWANECGEAKTIRYTDQCNIKEERGEEIRR